MNFEVTTEGMVKITIADNGLSLIEILTPDYGQAMVDMFQGAVDAALAFNERVEND